MQSHITINLVLEKDFCLRKKNFLKKFNCRIKVLIAWSYFFELAESLLRKGDKFSQMSAPTKSSTKSNDQYVTMCKTNWHRELAQVLLFKALINVNGISKLATSRSKNHVTDTSKPLLMNSCIYKKIDRKWLLLLW